MTKPEAKHRSRLLIMSSLCEFSLQRYIGHIPYGGSKDMSFHGGCFGAGDCRPGDLVALQSAPVSKWYLGWLVSRQQPEGWVCEQFTIESIEDGELGNWHNVGLIYYDRSRVENHPEWRWTDRQHEFYDRWKRVCFKLRDAYMYLPMKPKFQGDAVTLSVRVRFSFSETVIHRDFPDWRKVTKALMLEFYDAASAELAAEKPRVA